MRGTHHRPIAGFTLVELMIVVVIIGVLAAAAVPNFIQMQNRAKEGELKTNMHSLQLAAEDYAVQFDAFYANNAALVVSNLPGAGANLRNPFTRTTGSGVAWEDRASFAADPSSVAGISSYADSLSATYNIKGYGKSALLLLVLSAGQ
jgi:prepilin-type N-terminal cleavage/methylation domain-containing protein